MGPLSQQLTAPPPEAMVILPKMQTPGNRFCPVELKRESVLRYLKKTWGDVWPIAGHRALSPQQFRSRGAQPQDVGGRVRRGDRGLLGDVSKNSLFIGRNCHPVPKRLQRFRGPTPVPGRPIALSSTRQGVIVRLCPLAKPLFDSLPKRTYTLSEGKKGTVQNCKQRG